MGAYLSELLGVGSANQWYWVQILTDVLLVPTHQMLLPELNSALPVDILSKLYFIVLASNHLFMVNSRL